MLKLLILLVPFALFSCDKKAPPAAVDVGTPVVAPTPVEASIDIDDPATCQSCHANVYKEWTESMHSRAHHSKDPIYGSMRSLRMEKQGEEIAAKCAKCHTSRAPDAPESRAAKAGVSCASCHNVAEVHIEPGKVGVDALTWDKPGVLRSSRDLKPGVSPVHGTGPALDAMKDGTTLCLACHNVTKTPSGAFACTTGTEFKEAGGDESCVDCHMPMVNEPPGSVGGRAKHRSHAFLGPHRAWYQDDTSILEAAVDLTLAFDDDGLALTLRNTGGHSFPSGFPGRMAVLKVVGMNADGETIWTNFEENPMAESPDSVLNKVYHDKDGNRAPAAFAEKLVRDTRLGPNESRTVKYAVPAGVVGAKATLLYRLLPPPLAKKLGIADQPEAEPRKVLTVEANR